VRDILKARLTGPSESLVDDFPRFAVLLSRCDEFFVTADSVSMLAEAILTGKPVGIIPIAPSARAQLGRLLRRLGLKLKSNADLSLFWRYLDVGGLMGSVDHPVASEVSDTVAPAVEAVRQLFSRNPPGIKP
jgi:Predicted nucleoside-diphosphate-sugar epimerase